MTDYKNLMGYAAILFGMGFLLRSLLPAHAYNGPVVSAGINPIESWSGFVINGSGWETLTTLSSDFVITDLTVSETEDEVSCQVILSNQNNTIDSVKGHIATAGASTANYYYGGGANHTSHHFVSGMKVNAGETLYMYYSTSGKCHYNISGYHAHTP